MKLRVIKLLLVVMSFLIGSNSFANEFEFKVLAKKGTTQVQNKHNQRRLVKIGSALNTDDLVTIPNGGYLGLVHKSGKTIELTEPGTFRVTDLCKDVEAQSSNLANKYASYIISKLSEDVTDINYDYKKHLRVTGAVERGNGENVISLKMPKYVDILNDEILIQWNELSMKVNYVLTVKNMYGKAVYEQITPRNSLKLNLSDSEFLKDNLLIVNVKVENREDIFSDDYAIKKMPIDKIASLKQEVNNLQKVIGEPSSLNSLAIANFYEQNNLLVDALVEYEKAKNLSPDSPQFETAYYAFLIRHSF